MSKGCTHIAGVQTVTPSALGCEECLQSGSEWLHLRICRSCGHVGCCDDSPNKHATAHFHATGHPVIEGYDPPEGWGWCYVDEVMLDLSERATPHNGPIPRYHPSNNLAKLPFDFSVRVPRTQLRPRYGDGVDGAPLTGRRPRGEGRAGGGGADDPARSANPASAGAGEARDHPVQQPMACRSFRVVASASGAPLGAACRALDRAY